MRQYTIGSEAVKLTVSKIITQLFALATVMLLSRHLTLSEYGTYSQALMIINLISSIFMFGLPNSINYFLARTSDFEERKRFVSIYYSFSTVLSFVSGLVLVVSTPLIVKIFDNQLLYSLWYVFAVIPWTKIIISSVENFLIVYKSTLILLIYKFINSFLILLSALAVFFLNWDFKAYMVMYVFIQSLCALCVYLIVNNYVGKISAFFDFQYIKRILIFSLPIGISTVLGTIKIEMDKLVIALFCDTEQLAIYSNAAREMPVTIVATSLTAILLPQIIILLARNDKQNAIQIWNTAICLSYLFICFIAAGLLTYAPEIITLLYSEKYLSGVEVFRIYAIVLLFRFTYFGMFLNAVGKTKIILYGSILSLAANLLLNFSFYYIWGFSGPAIATTVATFVNASYLIISTTKEIEVSIKDIWPWKDLIKLTLLNMAFALVFYFLKFMLPFENYLGNVTEAIILVSVWGITYLMVMRKYLINKWNLLNSQRF